MLGFFIGVLLTFFVSAWLIRRRSRPLQRTVHEAIDQAQAAQQHVDSLLAERNQARAIVEAMDEGVIALDARDFVLLMNPAAEALFGVRAEEAAGRPLLEVLRHHELEEVVAKARASRKAAERDVAVFQPTERMLHACAMACDPSGPTGPHTVLVIQDLTQANRYERLRREFVANVSHELKSPLTAIRSLTETLLTGALDDGANRRRFVTLVDEEAARLGRLIDDLLQLSQLESQPAAPPVQPIRLAPLVHETAAAFEPEVAKRRLTLTVNVDSTWMVRADPDRLKQVFVNLLDNAIKYNREGGAITVTAQPDGKWLRVSVTDTGIGIPDDDLPRIFERFYRVDKARSRELGGTGLGLAIVKHIIESHGGTLTVTSRLGEGSTFTFTLPLHA